MSSLWAQFWAARHPPADPKDSDLFRNKSVLVTGANSGLGHEAAVKYAALGANPLILAVRTQEKGEQAKRDIIRRTNCAADIFIIETVDFSSFSSVRDFAARLPVDALHVAQLAAGVAQWKYEKTADGFETTLEVNVLSPALLALLLLPKMVSKAGDGPTHLSFLHSIAGFEVTASDVPHGQSLIQRLDDKSKWDPTKQYYLAKLGLWSVIEGLVRRCREQNVDDIIINATCPSGCKTNMGRNFPAFVKPILALQHFICGRTAEQGARSLISATTLGPESHGQLWRNDTIFPPSEFMSSQRGQEVSEETWHEILEILRQRSLI